MLTSTLTTLLSLDIWMSLNVNVAGSSPIRDILQSY